ncbi:MAG: heme a synthase, partial [Chloroflexota bacterium]|nr:heme a synthase [Chloroflexota bacterium]
MSRFRVLAMATAVAVYGQIVLGAVVRITGSGLGCPDWPLCHGQLVPNFFDYHVSIEYAHRAFGTASGLLVLATAVTAAVMYARRARAGDVAMPGGLALAAVATLALIAFQGVLGGITVLTGNTPFTVAIHLGNALLVLAAATVVVLWAGRVGADRRRGAQPAAGRTGAYLYGGAAGAFLIVVSGAYVVGSSAGGACPGWPLCGAADRSVFTDVHMLHRAVVLLGSFAILGAAYAGWRRWRGTRMAWAALLASLLLLLEVAVGALQAVLALPAGLRALHVALATAVWTATFVMAAGWRLDGRPEREPRSAR